MQHFNTTFGLLWRHRVDLHSNDESDLPQNSLPKARFPFSLLKLLEGKFTVLEFCHGSQFKDNSHYKWVSKLFILSDKS